MFRIVLSALLLFGIVGLFSMPVWAEQTMMFSVNSLSEFDVKETPVVYGTATDSEGNPLPGVEIQANFPSRMILATTDSAGEFSITYPITEELGEHTVTVYASKDKMYLSTQITYQVIDKQKIAESETLKNKDSENVPKISKYDNSKYNLHSRTILDKIEDQKKEAQKKVVISEEQQLIDKQRLQSHEDLEEELKSFEKQNEFYKPRNAFLRFLSDIDHTVKDIFWNQFLFTEKKTEDAHIAKEIALEEGKSTLEATKIFQKEAAVSQSEIMEYNKELSVKYVNATSSIQKQSDDNR